jgi:aldehyde:ferredoxin oxidoreductase
MKVKEIKSFKYKRPTIEKGYANHVLHINLSSSGICIGEVPEDTKKIFIGGKGFNLWLLWNSVKPTTKWYDPENAICIASGPLGGTPIYPGSGKSIVCAISPTTGSVMDSNVGGYFGPYLKFAGFDAMEIHGKAKNDTVIFIDGIENKIAICEISGLPKGSHRISEELTKHFGKDNPRSISVVSTGQGAKNTLIGCLNFSWHDSKRKKVRHKQAGRGGMGTVFADKGIKAIVVRWDGVTIKTNNPADEAELKEVGRAHSQEIAELDKKQNEMSIVGTGHLVTILCRSRDLIKAKKFLLTVRSTKQLPLAVPISAFLTLIRFWK